MNIYIPDDMKMRMDDRLGENWSGIAQRAFELHLNSTRKGNDEMTAVIERLRASKEKVELQQKPEWTQKGRDWASDDAEYDELQRVAMIDISGNQFGIDSLLVSLAAAIHDDPDPDGDLVNEVVEMLTGHENKLPTLNQLTWFMEGAQAVWYEVEDQI